jgi:hypothetical protein
VPELANTIMRDLPRLRDTEAISRDRIAVAITNLVFAERSVILAGLSDDDVSNHLDGLWTCNLSAKGYTEKTSLDTCNPEQTGLAEKERQPSKLKKTTANIRAISYVK